jgi:hypothetical protein
VLAGDWPSALAGLDGLALPAAQAQRARTVLAEQLYIEVRVPVPAVSAARRPLQAQPGGPRPTAVRPPLTPASPLPAGTGERRPACSAALPALRASPAARSAPPRPPCQSGSRTRGGGAGRAASALRALGGRRGREVTLPGSQRATGESYAWRIVTWPCCVCHGMVCHAVLCYQARCVPAPTSLRLAATRLRTLSARRPCCRRAC